MAYLYALVEAPTYFNAQPFPARLKRTEKVVVVSTWAEVRRLRYLLCAAPITGETCLYVMRDRRTALFKIGTSKNPVYRERTLQSDNPMVELVNHWEASSRHERYIHQFYAKHRVRGEWFDLTLEQVESIGEYMADEQRDQAVYEMYQRELERMNRDNQTRLDNLDISSVTGDLIRVVPIEEVYVEPDCTAEYIC